MRCEFQELNELLNINSIDALHHALMRILLGLGFDKYAYYSELKNRCNEEPTLLSNYPDEWLSYYVANGYGDIDPVFIAVKKSIIPIQWGGEEYLKSLSRQQRKLFSEAENYGICTGFTMPIHSPKRFSALTVASAESNLSFQKLTRENQPYLQLLALNFCEAVHQFTVTHPTSYPVNQLTKRERECLFFIAKGNNYDATATKMCVSRNTILYFAKNIRRKLGVSNIQHAVAIAIKNNLIDSQK